MVCDLWNPGCIRFFKPVHDVFSTISSGATAESGACTHHLSGFRLDFAYHMDLPHPLYFLTALEMVQWEFEG